MIKSTVTSLVLLENVHIQQKSNILCKYDAFCVNRGYHAQSNRKRLQKGRRGVERYCGLVGIYVSNYNGHTFECTI